MSQILVRFGTRGIFKVTLKKADKHKCLPALILRNEAEGTRTLNLRIDSPTSAFVSTCEYLVYNGTIKTYDADRSAAEA